MAIIPNIFDPVQPDIFTRVRTRERVNAVSGGSRVLAIVGEGETEEDLVVSANGGGADGWNSDFSGTNSPDGRHFKISKIGLIANRTSILKNGIPLAVIEGSITSTAFDNRYDARVDPLTGRVELQRAHLVDFGSDAMEILYIIQLALQTLGPVQLRFLKHHCWMLMLRLKRGLRE